MLLIREEMKHMDAERKSRALFTLANYGWTFLAILISGSLVAVGLWALGWVEVWPYVAFGAVAGAAVGAVRDPRIFQVMVAASGIVVFAFALYWADAGGMPPEALPLLGMTLISFGTLSALTRIWGREQRTSVPTHADLDAAVARPRMG